MAATHRGARAKRGMLAGEGGHPALLILIGSAGIAIGVVTWDGA